MKIFNPNTKDFSTNGLGIVQSLKCIEIKKKSLNGWYLECEVHLKYADFIIENNIVVVETKEKGAQPFFIESPEINSTICFIARHVAFLSERYVLDDVRPTNLIGNDFLNYINGRTDEQSPFSVSSNVSKRNTAYFIRKTLLEAFEETEVLYGGTYEIDKYSIALNTTINNISETTLKYGKNIEGVKIYENWDSVCTKILAVGPDGITLPEQYLSADIQYEIPYTRIVSFSIEKDNDDGSYKSEFQMIDELRDLAKKYLDEHKFPKVNYTITANVEQSLNIGDIVPVFHPLATFETEVISYRYDVVTKKVISIEYGNYERDVKKAFSTITDKIANIAKKTDNFLATANKEVEYLMNVVGKNGSVVFRKNDEGVIYEILFLDTKDIETAKTIMKFNSQGIAGTTEGINGIFNAALMANGTILADAIKAGTLRAISVEGVEFTNGMNFHVDKYGNLQCANAKVSGTIDSTSGNIGGFSITEDGLKSTYSETYEKFTENDYKTVMNYLLGFISLSEEEIKRLDVDKDGYLSASDYMLIQQMVEGKISHTIKHTFIISAKNPHEFIKHIIDYGTRVVENYVSISSISESSMKRTSERIRKLESEVIKLGGEL